MFSVKRVVLAGVAVLALTVVGAAPAFAGTNGGVTATTHSFLHEDTTNVSGSGTHASPNGPVWANDNLQEQFRITQTSPGVYDVQYASHGSFSAFADPTTGNAASFNGSVEGSYDMTVTSSTAPDPTALPAQEDPNTGIGTAVEQLFHGNATIAGGNYDFKYRAAQFKSDMQGDLGSGISVNGTLYEQVG